MHFYLSQQDGVRCYLARLPQYYREGGLTINLRNWLDRVKPHFDAGGRLQKLQAIYEMVDTFLYSPKTVTVDAPHVRDYLDLKRLMTYVVLATVPALLMGAYNTGYQANLAIAQGFQPELNFAGIVIDTFKIGYSADNPFACLVHGFLYFLPIYLVTLIAGGTCEVIFATIRKHEINEGFFVTSMLYALILPATTPLWQVALGIIFGVVIGKEIFGGTGMNFLNPALTGRVFLYFAYPASQSGDAVWVPVDGHSGATALSHAAAGGTQAVIDAGVSWWSALLGTIPGSLAETSALACVIGGIFLLYTRIANWRFIIGGLLGTILMASVLNSIGSDTNPAFDLPFWWHMVLGGYAFGLVFMVTDPVSGAQTNAGRWIYAFLIGILVVLIRVINPAFPEGMMLAILLGNIFAPLIDHFVIKANIRRRKKRYA